MADVGKAWSFVLGNEDPNKTGAVTEEPNGGHARFGINSLAHPEAAARGFFTMPKEQALEYAEDTFKYDYWSRILGYNIAPPLQIVASKWADLVFNAGTKEGVIIVQRALNTLRPQPLRVDGIAGAGTIAALNTFLKATQVEQLYQAILTEGAAFYKDLCAKKPGEFSPELEQEWLRRLAERPPS